MQLLTNKFKDFFETTVGKIIFWSVIILFALPTMALLVFGGITYIYILYKFKSDDKSPNLSSEEPRKMKSNLLLPKTSSKLEVNTEEHKVEPELYALSYDPSSMIDPEMSRIRQPRIESQLPRKLKEIPIPEEELFVEKNLKNPNHEAIYNWFLKAQVQARNVEPQYKISKKQEKCSHFFERGSYPETPIQAAAYRIIYSVKIFRFLMPRDSKKTSNELLKAFRY